MSNILRPRTLTQMLQMKAEVQSKIDMMLLERGMLQLNLNQSSSDEEIDTVIENTQEDCEISGVCVTSCETTYMNNNHVIDENQNYVHLHDEIKISTKETQTNVDQFKNEVLDLKKKLTRAEKLNQTLTDKIKRKDRYFRIMTEKNQDIIRGILFTTILAIVIAFRHVLDLLLTLYLMGYKFEQFSCGGGALNAPF